MKKEHLKDCILLMSYFSRCSCVSLRIPQRNLLFDFCCCWFWFGFFCLIWNICLYAASCTMFAHRQIPPLLPGTISISLTAQFIKLISTAICISSNAICCSDHSAIMLSQQKCLWQTILLLKKQSLCFDLYEELTHFLQTLFSFPLDIMKVKSNHISLNLLQHLPPTQQQHPLLACLKLLFKRQLNLSPPTPSSFE